MSKMRCRCGHIISNNVCPSPTEAWLMSDRNGDAFAVRFAEVIEPFLAALRGGRREEWVAGRYGADPPLAISDASVLWDLLGDAQWDHQLSVAECEGCGRLWLQRGVGRNEYRSFVPDEGGYERHFAADHLSPSAAAAERENEVASEPRPSGSRPPDGRGSS